MHVFINPPHVIVVCVCVHAACWGATESAVWATAASWGWAQYVCCRSTTTRSPPWTRVHSTHCTPCPPCEHTHTLGHVMQAHTQNEQHVELHSFFPPSNLLANPFNCNCHLAWLGDWLRRKRIVTGNPRCQNPYFLKEIPIQDVAVQDFACEDGEMEQNHVLYRLCNICIFLSFLITFPFSSDTHPSFR